MSATVKQDRSCATCGFTSVHEDERVVGPCVPGYHDLALIESDRPYTDLSRFFTEANRRPVADQIVTEFEAWMESQP